MASVKPPPPTPLYSARCIESFSNSEITCTTYVLGCAALIGITFIHALGENHDSVPLGEMSIPDH